MSRRSRSNQRAKTRSFRKSCNFCHEMKKKCDGDGTNSCSECISRNRICKYGRRRPRTKRDPGAAPATRTGSGRGSALEIFALQRPYCGASPATGLVGMAENSLLSAYFSCVSILPFATPSAIRSTMVSILFSPHQFRVREVSKKQRPIGHPMKNTTIEGGSSANAQAVTFWSAIALGGLMLGQPLDRVGRYVRLAETALDALAGVKTEETARGYAALTYVYSHWSEKTAIVEDNIRTAHEIIQDLAKRDPTGGASKDFCGLLQQMDLFCPVSPRHPRRWLSDDDEEENNDTGMDLGVHKFYTIESIYRHFTQFHKDLAKIILGGGSETPRSHGELERGGKAPADDARVPDAAVRSSHGDRGMSREHASKRNLLGRSSLHALAQLLAKHMDEVEWLNVAAQRPEIRNGIGGLGLNIPQVFLSAAKDDRKSVKEATRRCLDVMHRYPGLCRFQGCSAVHAVIMVVTYYQDRKMYAEVREVYNSHLPNGAPELPPLEDMSVATIACGRFMCRTLENIFRIRDERVSPSESPTEEDARGEPSLPPAPEAMNGTAVCRASSREVRSPGPLPDGYERCESALMGACHSSVTAPMAGSKREMIVVDGGHTSTYNELQSPTFPGCQESWPRPGEEGAPGARRASEGVAWHPTGSPGDDATGVIVQEEQPGDDEACGTHATPQVAVETDSAEFSQLEESLSPDDWCDALRSLG